MGMMAPVHDGTPGLEIQLGGPACSSTMGDESGREAKQYGGHNSAAAIDSTPPTPPRGLPLP